MTTINTSVRVRFAPSPTGHLHVGGARSAMFNWLFARHTGGTYFLRVEDTDVLRSTKEYLESQLKSLEWLGLLPDQPLVYQMTRVQEHLKAAQSLIDQGLAYPCFCPPRAADDVTSDLEQGIGNKYPGTCRDKPYTPQDLQQPHAIRFKLPSDLVDVQFSDLILGPIYVKAEQLDDYVIIRRDGTPIYNFCVVVDDIFMNITHVIRGQDHISNTPKQILLYRALGSKEPQFAHIPLILGPGGAKLSKRDAAVSVEEYRMQGYLPDALFNYLIRLGWSHGDQEVFTKDELVQYFDLNHVGKKGGMFDLKKLQWLNSVYMRAADAGTILTHLAAVNPTYQQDVEGLWQKEQLYKLIDEYKQRAVTLVELYHNLVSLAQHPTNLDLKLIEKWHTAATPLLLNDFVAGLSQLSVIDHDTLLALAQTVCERHGSKLVQIAQPLRLALTGSIVSPGVFELIAILGPVVATLRINELIKIL